MDEASLKVSYTRRYRDILVPLATSLESYLRGVVTDIPRIDLIKARAKRPESFMEKAFRFSEESAKYSSPLDEIQDQIGVRMVVFYRNDVSIMEDLINKFFRVYKTEFKSPECSSEFDYEALHKLLLLPSDILEPTWKKGDYPIFFELQIATLFQHAWAEANHDLAYKPKTDMTHDQKRLIAYTNALAWGADVTFETLTNQLMLEDIK